MPSVEPFIMDTLSLALTGGPNGYRINLKDMEVFGASNFTVKSIKWVWMSRMRVLIIFIYFLIRLGEGDKPFEAVVTIPKLSIKAKYTSSGVLIIIPASGGGEFSAIFGNLRVI